MEDFHQSLFQMVSFRMLGARILPSLLSLLPQTEIYREWSRQAELEFCPYLFPEFVFTGHEICRGGEVELPAEHAEYFHLITANPDIFPGFFHIDLAGQRAAEAGVAAAVRLLSRAASRRAANAESCGAHSPRVAPQELATRTSRS